jgi:LysM repeat protein
MCYYRPVKSNDIARRELMPKRTKPMILFGLLLLAAVTFSACERPYGTVSLNTPTPIATSLFVSPFPTSDNPMAMVEELSTGTAIAETAAALTAGTPATTEESGPSATPDPNATATQTPDVSAASATPTLGSDTITATQPSPTTTVGRPASYTLQSGEFPYCIARRFNVDPDELLDLNNLASGDVYYPNLTLTIPQTGNPFPGTRALRSHPDTYTVDSADETIYAVACYYGDVDPAAISQANNVPLTATLNLGQQLSIP